MVTTMGPEAGAFLRACEAIHFLLEQGTSARRSNRDRGQHDRSEGETGNYLEWNWMTLHCDHQ